MNYFIFFLINTFFFLFLLFLFTRLLKNKFFFPFRILDIYNFLTNLIIFTLLSHFLFNTELIIATIIINFNFFYILFHIQNMINTSPRTKILLDIYNKKNIKKYTEEIIVKNRIKRLISNKQIFFENKVILLNKKKNIFFFINFLFKVIKKF